MQITIEVPDSLGHKLQQFSDRLPELLERGLRELQNEQFDNVQSGSIEAEQEIMAVLASQPTPEQILSIRPSVKLQTRVSDLLAQSKTNTLSQQDTVELERYLTLEHLVRLAKAQAYHPF